jgi:hypothetical protein
MARSFDVQAALRAASLIAALLTTSCRVYDAGLLAAGDAPSQLPGSVAADGGNSPRMDSGALVSADAGFTRPDVDRTAEAGATAGSAGSATAGAPGGTGGSAGAPATNHDDDDEDDAGTLLTDPVGCPEAHGGVWSRNGHCYFPLNVGSSWSKSRDRCRELGAELVTIASEPEQAFVGGLIGEAPRWIGLSRFGTSTFSWIDGARMTFEHWEPGAPSGALESAALVRNDTLLWFDVAVSQSHPALCERALPK